MLCFLTTFSHWTFSLRLLRVEPARVRATPLPPIHLERATAETDRRTSATALGFGLRRFVFNHVPMLDQESINHTNEVRNDPVLCLAEARKATRLNRPSRPGSMWGLCCT